MNECVSYRQAVKGRSWQMFVFARATHILLIPKTQYNSITLSSCCLFPFCCRDSSYRIIVFLQCACVRWFHNYLNYWMFRFCIVVPVVTRTYKRFYWSDFGLKAERHLEQITVALRFPNQTHRFIALLKRNFLALEWVSSLMVNQKWIFVFFIDIRAIERGLLWSIHFEIKNIKRACVLFKRQRKKQVRKK